MQKKILVTGAKGLIGTEVCRLLASSRYQVILVDRNFEKSHPGSIDTRDRKRMEPIVDQCNGIIHLAAISRVVWGEQNPQECWEVNVEATSSIVGRALQSPNRPWLLFASSREVYGQQKELPVLEEAPFGAMNTYARSKVAGEGVVQSANEQGLVTSIARFSNVFGCPNDHADRVIPAFCRAALQNEPLRVDGFHHVFDFTYYRDVAHGVMAIVEHLENKKSSLPPIHFTSGRGLTLYAAATMICQLAGSRPPICEGIPRSFDVSAFVGDPARAAALLGWKATTSFEEGVVSLLNSLLSEVLV